MTSPLLTYRIGKEYPLGFTILGAILTFIGFIFATYSNDPASELPIASNIGFMTAGILITIGTAMVLAHTGVRLNPNNRKIKIYTWVLFLKVGKWISLENYDDLIILRKKRVFGFGTQGDHGADNYASQIDYEVYITEANHFDKILIFRHRNKGKVYQAARTIAENMQCKFVQFNPGRRYKRRVLSFDLKTNTK